MCSEYMWSSLQYIVFQFISRADVLIKPLLSCFLGNLTSLWWHIFVT
jgi:hypothetical protein